MLGGVAHSADNFYQFCVWLIVCREDNIITSIVTIVLSALFSFKFHFYDFVSHDIILTSEIRFQQSCMTGPTFKMAYVGVKKVWQYHQILF